MLEEILAYNKKFVEDKGYEAYITNKYPDKKIAILSCMDTRLTALLPAALGIKNGDVKMIKNAGGVISHPFGSVIRSLLVAIFELGVEEIMVIAHSDCGACHMHSEEMLEKMKARGINPDYIDMMRFCGVDFHSWLDGFEDTEKSVRGTVDFIVHHPLIPVDVAIVIISKLPKSLVVLFIISGLIVCILFALDSRIQINRFNLLKTNILLFIRKITCNSYSFCLFAGLL